MLIYDKTVGGKFFIMTSDGHTLKFDVNHYAKLTNPTLSEYLESYCSTLKTLVASLPSSTIVKLESFYHATHDILKVDQKEGYLHFIRIIRASFSKLMVDTSLANNVLEFCRTDHFVYPDIIPFDPLIHDLYRTFNQEHFEELTAFQITCALMVPIWGETLHQLESTRFQTSLKTFEQYPVLLDIMAIELWKNTIASSYDKLMNIFDAIVQKRFTKLRVKGIPIDLMLATAGISESEFVEHCKARLLTKQLPMFNSIHLGSKAEPPHIVAFLIGTFGHLVEAQLLSIRKTTTIAA